MVSSSKLDDLMHRAWPPASTVAVDGWVVRLANGVTRRANSVLPICSPQDVEDAIHRVEAVYTDHGVEPTFHIGPATQPLELDALLAARGYDILTPTLVKVGDLEAACNILPPPRLPVTVHEDVTDAWMTLWWSVDGRGGPHEKEVARHILLSCQSVYATLYDEVGVAAVGRLAVVEDWGGLYCMATRADARRQGYGTAILQALLEAAAGRGIRHAWLQVVEQNRGARALYEGAGFVTASRYHYRVRRTAGSPD